MKQYFYGSANGHFGIVRYLIVRSSKCILQGNALLTSLPTTRNWKCKLVTPGSYYILNIYLNFCLYFLVAEGRVIVGAEMQYNNILFSVNSLHLDHISEETRLRQLQLMMDHLKREGI